jgi:hypothetical protein
LVNRFDPKISLANEWLRASQENGSRGAAVFLKGTIYMRIGMMGGIIAASVMLCGCATVTRGTRQTFKVESTPSGAQVAMSNGENCVTPCKLKIKRRPGFSATFTKEGYEPQTVKVDSELHGGGVAAGAGDLLLGGVVGGLLDGSNGSLNSLSPNPLQVTLVPAQGTPAARVGQQ